MTTELVRQQQVFAAALRNLTEPDPALLQRTPQGHEARFHIYTHGYRVRMIEALQENYPVLARVLGDDDFAALANDFVQANPSQTASIRWFGATLAEFVARQPEQLPHLALLDLIRMEWALSTAFDSPDAETLVADALTVIAAETWPQLRFVAHPSVQLLAMQWNVEPIWSALSNDPDASTDAPDELAHHLLVWRAGHVNQWRSLQEQEATLLAALMSGCSFGELCAMCESLYENQLDITEQVAATVAGYLRSWVDSGLLQSVREF